MVNLLERCPFQEQTILEIKLKAKEETFDSSHPSRWGTFATWAS